jgi:hypothetical protein
MLEETFRYLQKFVRRWQSMYSLIKYSRATNHVSWSSGKKNNVSRTGSVLVFRVLMYLENQFVSDIGLPEFHVHDSALASGSCCHVSRACCIRPAS